MWSREEREKKCERILSPQNEKGGADADKVMKKSKRERIGLVDWKHDYIIHTGLWDWGVSVDLVEICRNKSWGVSIFKTGTSCEIDLKQT